MVDKVKLAEKRKAKRIANATVIGQVQQTPSVTEKKTKENKLVTPRLPVRTQLDPQ